MKAFKETFTFSLFILLSVGAFLLGCSEQGDDTENPNAAEQVAVISQTVSTPTKAEKDLCPYLNSEEYSKIFQFKEALNDTTAHRGDAGIEDRSWEVVSSNGVVIGMNEAVISVYETTDESLGEITYGFYFFHAENNLTITELEIDGIGYKAYLSCKELIRENSPIAKDTSEPPPSDNNNQDDENTDDQPQADFLSDIITNYGIINLWSGYLTTDQNYIYAGTNQSNLYVIGLHHNDLIDTSFGTSGVITIASGKPYLVNNIEVDSLNNIYVLASYFDESDGYILITRIKENGQLDTSFGSNGHMEWKMTSQNRWKKATKLSLINLNFLLKDY